MTGHALQGPCQQVVYHVAAAIFISDRKSEELKGKKKAHRN